MKHGKIVTIGDLEYIWLNGHFYPNQPYMLAFIGAQIDAEQGTNVD